MTPSPRTTSILDGPGLVLLALASAFFPRVLTAYGAPAVLNFAHFGVVTALFAFSMLRGPVDSFRKVGLGLYGFATLIAFSALFNRAGLINAILEWVLLLEPFLMLGLVVNTAWTKREVDRFAFWVFMFALINVLLAHLQFAQGALSDDVKGVFLNQGAGHHVNGAVALTAGIYFFVHPPFEAMKRWQAALLGLFMAAVVVTSDSKQVIAVFMGAGGLLLLFKLVAALRGEASGRRVVGYFAALLIAGAVVTYAAFTFFPALRGWARPELIQTGLAHKFSVFSIIASHFQSDFNWLIGLGPGHTVGRLGSLMPDYIGLLAPLDATTNPATRHVVFVSDNHWMTSIEHGSSMWALNFSYAGIWGDLGFLGIALYLGVWLIVWKKLCHDDLSRYFVLTVLIFGVIFAWLEEPGYMLFVASLIGLRHLRWRTQGRAS